MADESEPQWPGLPAMLEEIAAEHAALHAVVAGLTPTQCEAPVLDGGRSVKDVLAHLMYWQAHLARNVRVEAFGEGLPPVEFGTVEDEDERNERVFQKYRLARAADVARLAEQQWAETWALLQTVPEAAWLMMRPGRDYPLWYHITGNTSEHEREHRQQIEAALAAGRL